MGGAQQCRHPLRVSTAAGENHGRGGKCGELCCGARGDRGGDGSWLLGGALALGGLGLERQWARWDPVWFAQDGAQSSSIEMAAHWELLAGNLVISAIVAAVALRYFYVQHQWRRQLERETQARIQALRSRIRPHFLFNSMNTIASFTRSDPVLAEQVVEDLAERFRFSLSDARVPNPLERELELARQYVRIEGVRLGDRLRVEWIIGDIPSQALLPALTLQPLIENPVYHGIEPDPSGGSITIRAGTDNTRPGPPKIALQFENSIARGVSGRTGHRMALDNVTERIGAFFGAAGSVQIESTDERFVVTLRFPVLTEVPA